MENGVGQPQNVVVFGGSSDIARALTKKLCLARTHTVVLAGRNQALLDAAALEAQEYGATKTDTVLFDAEDPSTPRRPSPKPSRRRATPSTWWSWPSDCSATSSRTKTTPRSRRA